MSVVMTRAFQPEDLNFILSTWLRCYRYNSHTVNRVPSRVFYAEHQKFIERLLKKSTALIAVMKEDPSVILGYLVSEPNTLHFCYVKKACRGEGIGRQLLKDSGFDLSRETEFSHFTTEMDAICRKFPTLIFNPYQP